MNNESQMIELGEVVQFSNGKTIPKSQGDYPAFGGNGIVDYVDDYNSDANTIIVGRVGANCGNVNFSKDKCWVTDNAIAIQVKGKNDPKYLYYALSKKGLRKYKGGSGQPLLTQTTLTKIDISLPTYEDQIETSKKISAFEEKVELNHQLIANLEDYAQLLFHKWFADFNFPNEKGIPYKEHDVKMSEIDGETLPIGWDIGTLTSIARYENGLAMQKHRPKGEVFLPVIKIRELKQGYTDSESEKCDIDIKDSVKIYDGDVIFSWSASLFVDIWNGGNAGLNQHLFKVTSEKYPKWFYYFWTKRHLSKFIQIAAGKKTTMGHINRKHLEKATVLIPKEEQLKLMSKIMSPIFQNITLLKKENLLLKEGKDLLISKLIKK